MKIIRIFANLFALEVEAPTYPLVPKDALSQTLAYWKDLDAIEAFFLNNHSILQAPYFQEKKLFGGAPEENALGAALLLQKQAADFETFLLKNCRAGTLDYIFRFLNNNQYEYRGIDRSKAKNTTFPFWLRIYAIRLEEECYLITGGGIKLTEKMSEHKNTQDALSVINRVRDWLVQEGIHDRDSLSEIGHF